MSPTKRCLPHHSMRRAATGNMQWQSSAKSWGDGSALRSVSVSRSACLTCVAAGSDDLPWPRSSSMDIDTDKIDEAVLALLYLTLHDGVRAWKGHDWDALDRLYRKGMIENTVGKAKSVVLTDEGLAESERLFRNLFERSTP